MKKLLLVPLVVAMTACSSVKYSQDLQVDAPKFGSSSSDEVNYPEWYTKNTDDKALYAVASEYSKDMQFATDKAMLSAKRELASNFSSHVSSMMKDYAAEAGQLNNDVLREINRTTKLMVAEVNMIGVQRTNLKVTREKDGYRAWVKLRYAVDDTNRLLVEEIRRNQALELKLDSSKSFQELEENVDKLKGRKVAAATVPQQPAPVIKPIEKIKEAPGIDARPVDE
jgi:murein DD-endopeptidase MepM/ murein hydrolase activator NlpD